MQSHPQFLFCEDLLYFTAAFPRLVAFKWARKEYVNVIFVSRDRPAGGSSWSECMEIFPYLKGMNLQALLARRRLAKARQFS